MIQLHVLGTLDLRDESGREIRPVLEQPKRLALLTYLVLSMPRRFHRRDSLLARFWPDLDSDHARAALRQATYHLRRALGPDLLLGRGEEELGINLGQLWCDAIEFEDRIAASREEEAMALYGGELLDGLFVNSAPDFERWLDGERSRLRALASGTAWEISRKEQEAGRVERTVYWGKRALGISPDDETALRRLMTLLHTAGDLAGAFRAYAEFSSRLFVETGLYPSECTQTLVRGMREGPSVSALSAGFPASGCRPASWSLCGKFAPAEALAASGHPKRAIEWFGFLPHAPACGLAYTALTHFRIGEYLRGMGDVHGAREHFRQFLALLSRHDAEMAPLAAAAETWLDEARDTSRSADTAPPGDEDLTGPAITGEKDGFLPEAASKRTTPESTEGSSQREVERTPLEPFRRGRQKRRHPSRNASDSLLPGSGKGS